MATVDQLILIEDTLNSLIQVSNEHDISSHYHQRLVDNIFDTINDGYGIGVSAESISEVLGDILGRIVKGFSQEMQMNNEQTEIKKAPEPRSMDERISNSQKTKLVPLPVIEVTLTGFYGGRLVFESADNVVKEMQKIIHFARDLLQSFPYVAIMQEYGSYSPWYSKYAMTWMNLKYREFLGERVFEDHTLENGELKVMRVTSSKATRKVYEAVDNQLLQEKVTLRVSDAAYVMITCQNIINIEMPAFIKAFKEINTNVDRILTASKFKDDKFKFNDGEKDTKLYEVWESYRHVALVFYYMVSKNAEKLLTSVTKVEVI